MKKILVISKTVSSYHSPIFKKIGKNNYLHALYYRNDQFINWYNPEYKTVIKKNKKLFIGYKFTFINSSNSILKLIEFTYKLINTLLKYNIKNILIFGYDHPTCWIAIITGKILNRNILWRGEAILKKENFIKKIIKKIYLKTFFSMCDYLFYSCDNNRKLISKYSASKLWPYPCSVDNLFFRKKFFYLKKKKNDLIQKYKLSNSSFKIVAVSRLTKRKNLAYLLKEIYLSKIKNIEILIVGNGPEYEKLIKLAKKLNLSVKFFGYQEHEEVCRILSIANLYCLVSNFDASPKSLNEALNFKLPIIIRDTIGTAGDLIIDNFNGVILKKKDKLNLVLKDLIKDKKKQKLFSKNSYKTLDSFFNHDVCKNNIIKKCL